MKSQRTSLLCAAVAFLSVTAAAAACAACDTALLVIDVQNAYVRTLDLTTIDGIPLVDRLVQVLATARAAGIPIVYIQHRDPRFAPGAFDLAVTDAITPHVGDPVVWKSHPNAFWDTDLRVILANLGVRRLLVSGLSTTGCVDATVFGAVQLGFETWVLADAHSGGGSLDMLAYYNTTWPAVGANVVRSDEVNFAAFGCGTP